MVRLRDAPSIQTSHTKSLFQFQYGAIERREAALEDAQNGNFNSSMVRLREIPIMQVSVLVPDFNSSMVRLREEEGLRLKPYKCNFNSSMVRLRVGSRISVTHDQRYFNSSMVRLRGELLHLCLNC